MSHVDDGMLHGYLDGALSALDAVRVERHVADCAACRQRLDGARALIQRAARLLEWASPPADRAAPPLADLRPVAQPRWRVPAAWAATIVIALGAGIYGSRILLRGNDSAIATRELDSRDSLLDQRAAPLVAQVPESQPPRQVAVAPTPAAAESEQPAEPPAAPAPTGAGAVAPRDTTAALNRMADVATAAKARADTAQARSQTDSIGALALGARRERQDAMTPAPAPAAPAERRAATPSYRAEGAAAEAPVALTITTDSARILLGTSPVALPDYPVNAIRVRDGVVTVEQVLPPGRVLRLVQRRAAASEEQERAASELLARYVDGLRVEISGPMPPDSLSRLLERARAMP